jgi:hypothetical protein
MTNLIYKILSTAKKYKFSQSILGEIVILVSDNSTDFSVGTRYSFYKNEYVKTHYIEVDSTAFGPLRLTHKDPRIGPASEFA